MSRHDDKDYGCSFCGKTNEEATTETITGNATDTYQSIDINIGCMKGPTGIGMIKLLSDSDNKLTANHYNYTIATCGLG